MMPHALEEHPEWLLGSMIGRSTAMQRLFSQMRCTARHLRIATIEGESGTGKTLAARTLHDLGPAAAGPFVPCVAAQFFQSGPALASLTPLAADAREGTLFLGRLEELSLDQQTRLIGFLQWIDHQQSRRAPDQTPRQVFFSSRVPLRTLAASPQFRADLCHRLTAIRFIMPPLRERGDDLALLADSFARHFSSTHGKLIRGIGPQTLERLAAHNWPGNLRELQSVIQTAALDCEGQWIRPIDLPVLSPAPETHSAVGSNGEEDPNLDRAILRHVNRVLARVDGNKLRAAKMLGISRSTLYRLLDAASVNRLTVDASRLTSQS
jgi:DNA-binding NtrC family response regulator